MVTVYAGELRLARPDTGWIDDVRRRTPFPRLLYGHFSFGVHGLLGVAPRYATFLRHPVDRVVSLYRHHAADPRAAFHQRISEGMTPGEFATCRDTEENNNHMCRVIGGIPPQAGVRLDDGAIVDTAVDHLRRYFVFVGFVERFEESMRALERVIGAPLQRDLRLNAARRPAPALGPSDRQAIERENALDMELFERARRLGAAR
jgi:hypothetical protein